MIDDVSVFKAWERSKIGKETAMQSYEKARDKIAWTKDEGNLRNINRELNELVSLCCDPNYITIENDGVRNIESAFRAYFTGMSLDRSEDITSSYLDGGYRAVAVAASLDKQDQDVIHRFNTVRRVAKEAGELRKVDNRRPDRNYQVFVPAGDARQADAASSSRAVAASTGLETKTAQDIAREQVGLLKAAGREYVFFDLDDTLIRHSITNSGIRNGIFGQGSTMGMNPYNDSSFLHANRQIGLVGAPSSGDPAADRQKRDFVNSLVPDPVLVKAFMEECKSQGIKVGINTLNSVELARTLVDGQGWPVSSISAANGQILDYDKGNRVVDTKTLTEGKPRKVSATINVVGGKENLSKVAFFDDDFSRENYAGEKNSETLIELEKLGVIPAMLNTQEGVRFCRPDVNKEFGSAGFYEEMERVNGVSAKIANEVAENRVVGRTTYARSPTTDAPPLLPRSPRRVPSSSVKTTEVTRLQGQSQGYSLHE